jgi:hypothetical protein
VETTIATATAPMTTAARIHRRHGPCARAATTTPVPRSVASQAPRLEVRSSPTQSVAATAARTSRAVLVRASQHRPSANTTPIPRTMPRALAYPTGSLSSEPSYGSSGGGSTIRWPRPKLARAAAPATTPARRARTVDDRTRTRNAARAATYSVQRSASRSPSAPGMPHDGDAAIVTSRATSEVSATQPNPLGARPRPTTTTIPVTATKATVAHRHVLS